jgi:Zn-dependent protease|uniref:Site-2 protease family protein n=1 Tax=Desulfobacca acetoxidans TaxID=60893 RepID=A0A7C5EN25_9BACT
MEPAWPIPYVPLTTPYALDAFVSFCVAVLLAVLVNAEGQAFGATILGDRRVGAKDRFHFIAFFHLDPLGTINYLLGGFGWPRPVDIDPGRFAHPRLYTFLSRLAGPLANLLLANIAASIVHLFRAVGVDPQVFLMVMGVNLTTAVYNLIPFPPLAAGVLLTTLVAPPGEKTHELLELAGPFLVLALTLLGLIDQRFSLHPWLAPLVQQLVEFLVGP